jgi:hypothetical protein
MKKYKLYKFIIISIFIFNSNILANGNTSRFELGTAIVQGAKYFFMDNT